MKQHLGLLGALLLLAGGCAVNTDVAFDASQAEDVTAKADAYFIVTHQDYRKCKAPMCGGWFVEKLNQKGESHVFTLDASALSLDAASDDALDAAFGTGHAIVKGKIKQINNADTLIASAAWRAAANVTPKGASYSVKGDGGVDCAVIHCLAWEEKKLNTTEHQLLGGVDLGAAGAPDELVTQGYEAMKSGKLLVTGSHKTVKALVGPVPALVASEFYLPVTAVKECASKKCGPALGMPNKLCSDGVHVSGPTGRCIDKGAACGWEIASCP